MIHYFTDPLLSAPTIGSMLMCLIAGFVGTFSVLKRQSLVGEALSHASYPGVICALLFVKMYFDNAELSLLFVPLIGAALASLFGMYVIQTLVATFRVSSDSALCFVLASFFGIAIMILSCLQSSYPTLYRELQGYLFGQAATQTSVHIAFYAGLTILAVGTVVAFYRPLKTVIFDPEFAKTIGIDCDKVNFVLLCTSVLAVVVGIRALGVVLMSSMLIFPAVTSRLWSHRLEYVLLLSCLFGLLSGFFGVFLSHEMSQGLTSFPTGPMIVLTAASLFLFSVIASPSRGLFFCTLRKISFWNLCQQENLLKALWKANSPHLQRAEIEKLVQMSPSRLTYLLRSLVRKGWLKAAPSGELVLTPSGMLWGRKIVRLHRLWEVYLVEYCGANRARVHPSAEEMEHIITPEIEQELEVLLQYPRRDPHTQLIPRGTI